MQRSVDPGLRKPDPFWLRIPAFFFYGLKPRPLLFVIALAALSALFSNSLVALVLYALAIKYAVAALQKTASGELSPPGFTYEVLIDGYELPIMLYVILGIYIAILFSVAGSVGLLPAVLLYLAGVLLFPALVISLVVSESFSVAFNPTVWLRVAMRVGWPYLALFVFVSLLGSAESTLTELLLQRADGEWLSSVGFAINGYFSIVTFHMLGYVVFQYHEELGRPTVLAAEVEASEEAAYPLVEKFIAEGNTEAATAELIALTKEHPDDLELRRRLHNYLMATGQDDGLAEYGGAFLNQLIQAGDMANASRVYLDCLQRGRDCRPTDPGGFLPLMRALRGMGRFAEAVKLGKNFHRRFPDSDHTPPVYLELAKILCEDLQRDDLALKALKFVVKGFPGHALLPQVREFMGVVEQLAAAK